MTDWRGQVRTGRYRGLGGNYWKLWSASTLNNLGQGVSVIAFPWLATTLTSDPVLIAIMAVATRLPWLLFSLPAGVIADRMDRRAVMGWMSGVRALVVGGVALAVYLDSMTLLMLYLAALALGFTEVLFDSTAQVIVPAVSPKNRLEDANGNIMGGQIVMNDFVGRPVGGLLVAGALALPFLIDSLAALLAALMLVSMTGSYRAQGRTGKPLTWRRDLAEGLSWLWRHRLLRSLMLVLAGMNLAFSGVQAIFVLFAQEVLGVAAFGFGLLMTAMGVGAIIGSQTASTISRRIGPGNALFLVLAGSAAAMVAAAVSQIALLVGAAFAVAGFFTVLWNVITVSLRQSLISDHLLGRVNSVFRFFGWGAIPVGSLLGGLVVTVTELVTTRTVALIMPFFLTTAMYLLLLLFALPRLHNRAIHEARTAADTEAAPATDTASATPDRTADRDS